ncbi:MAG: PCP reductase family protein [Microcystaceae cyanobacterium]
MGDFDGSIPWTSDAKQKLKNIPYFVRTQARQRIEQVARDEGLATITVEIVEQVRLEFGQ